MVETLLWLLPKLRISTKFGVQKDLEIMAQPMVVKS